MIGAVICPNRQATSIGIKHDQSGSCTKEVICPGDLTKLQAKSPNQAHHQERREQSREQYQPSNSKEESDRGSDLPKSLLKSPCQESKEPTLNDQGSSPTQITLSIFSLIFYFLRNLLFSSLLLQDFLLQPPLTHRRTQDHHGPNQDEGHRRTIHVEEIRATETTQSL